MSGQNGPVGPEGISAGTVIDYDGDVSEGHGVADTLHDVLDMEQDGRRGVQWWRQYGLLRWGRVGGPQLLVSVIQTIIVVIERPGVIVLVVPAVLLSRIVAVILPVVEGAVGVTELLRVEGQVGRLALVLVDILTQSRRVGRGWGGHPLTDFLLTALYGEAFDGSSRCGALGLDKVQQRKWMLWLWRLWWWWWLIWTTIDVHELPRSECHLTE